MASVSVSLSIEGFGTEPCGAVGAGTRFLVVVFILAAASSEQEKLRTEQRASEPFSPCQSFKM